MVFNILFLEDDLDFAGKVIGSFSETFRFHHVTSADQAFALFEKTEIDIALLDIFIPGPIDGREILRKIVERDPTVVCFMATADDSLSTIRDCIDKGALGYIRKPYRLENLRVQLEVAVELRKRALSVQVKDEIISRTAEDAVSGIIGTSRFASELRQKVAEWGIYNDLRVLITGESGTGKEVVARAIHKAHRKTGRPFIAINCAAIPVNLIESELFGYERGAFTGAVQRKIGCFELADRGDLFLDEIGELSGESQAKLLRVIQEKEFKRVGGNTLVKSDFRLICATNQDLDLLISQGKFRRDLYYRIHTFPIRLLPLRERPEDIPVLIAYILEEMNQKLKKKILGLDEELLAELKNAPWEGNVRELRSVIEYGCVRCRGDKLSKSDVDIGVQVKNREKICSEDFIEDLVQDAKKRGLLTVISECEQKIIARVMASTRNQYNAATLLGLKPSTLSDKLRRYNERVS